jgi:hypothetical protein
MKWREIKTEGLPKENLMVLWYDCNGVYRVGRLYDGDVNWGDRWQSVKAFFYWMPLPKPPKKEGA